LESQGFFIFQSRAKRVTRREVCGRLLPLHLGDRPGGVIDPRIQKMKVIMESEM
jgi:hypothetical protein